MPLFHRWAAGEPDDHLGEDCLALVLSEIDAGIAGDWVDEDCTNPRPFSCDLGADDVDGVCTTVVVAGKRRGFCPPSSWTSAAETCIAVGGVLSAVTSASESDALASALAAEYPPAHGAWIGGSDRAVEGDWRWSDNAGIVLP